jgi:hypothetical protein
LEVTVNHTNVQSMKVTCMLKFLSLLATGLLGGLAAQAATATSGTFAYTGSLNVARYNHIATLLPSGEVLVAGGEGGTAAAFK